MFETIENRLIERIGQRDWPFYPHWTNATFWKKAERDGCRFYSHSVWKRFLPEPSLTFEAKLFFSDALIPLLQVATHKHTHSHTHLETDTHLYKLESRGGCIQEKSRVHTHAYVPLHKEKCACSLWTHNVTTNTHTYTHMHVWSIWHMTLKTEHVFQDYFSKKDTVWISLTSTAHTHKLVLIFSNYSNPYTLLT